MIEGIREGLIDDKAFAVLVAEEQVNEISRHLEGDSFIDIALLHIVM